MQVYKINTVSTWRWRRKKETEVNECVAARLNGAMKKNSYQGNSVCYILLVLLDNQNSEIEQSDQPDLLVLNLDVGILQGEKVSMSSLASA
jgi:hypothetical protein